MLLIDNFVHADLHPGNIMVRFYQPSERGCACTTTPASEGSHGLGICSRSTER
jgi:predicted unusual protein kinase regulating ubiquinone biosynthesis (AarF/ABC1/UbiB family)